MEIAIIIFILFIFFITGYYVGNSGKNIDIMKLEIKHRQEMIKLIQDHTLLINEVKRWILNKH